MNKSTVQEIRERFDNDVERFSNLETGQISTIDATISLELITQSAKSIIPNAKEVLDIGCGAGNYTLMMLKQIPNLNCTLLDISKPMLDRAFDRVSRETEGEVEVIQSDIRLADFREKKFDIILAGAVLHHLRDDKDWQNTFEKLFNLLNNGGCIMISDLITQNVEVLQTYMEDRYGDYLESVNGKEYRKNVLDYIEKEDTPRSLIYQLDLMKKVGFSKIDVLHKNLCFATFCGIK